MKVDGVIDSLKLDSGLPGRDHVQISISHQQKLCNVQARKKKRRSMERRSNPFGKVRLIRRRIL